MPNDFFDKQISDFERLYPESRRTGRGLTGPDIAGIGLQLYGASLQDKAAEEEEAERKRLERLSMILGGRERRSEAQRDVIGDQQTQRSLNMGGANMLTEMRRNALQNRRLYSTRNAILGAF